MSVGFNTIFGKKDGSTFEVKNLSDRTIKIFNQGISSGKTYDLMNISYVSEADIKHSLLKGELRKKIEQDEIRIVESTIDLVQYDESFTDFLQDAGATVGITDVTGGALNLSELSSLNDLALKHGTSVSVASLQDSFILDKNNNLISDNITIVETRSGAGRWVRLNNSSTTWLTQPNWWIDPTNGSDENRGNSSSSALKTLSEFFRRVGSNSNLDPLVTFPNFGTITVNLLEDLPDTSELGYTVTGTFSFGLVIQGQRTVIHSGAITSVQNYNDATNTDGRITDTSLTGTSWNNSGPGGTSLIDKMIVLTSGPNSGAVAWLSHDLGGKIARHSPFINLSTLSIVNPSVGNTYNVVELTAIPGIIDVHGASGTITFKDCDLQGDSANLLSFSHGGSNIGLFSFGCSIGGLGPTLHARSGFPGQFFGCKIAPSNSIFLVANYVQFSGCLFQSRIISYGPAGFIEISGGCLSDGKGTNSDKYGLLAQEMGSNIKITGFYALIDSNASGDAAITLSPNTSLRIGANGRLWGTGINNSGFGVMVDSGSSIYYSGTGSSRIGVTGTGLTEINLGGNTSATFTILGTTGIINAVNLAKIVPASFFT